MTWELSIAQWLLISELLNGTLNFRSGILDWRYKYSTDWFLDHHLIHFFCLTHMNTFSITIKRYNRGLNTLKRLGVSEKDESPSPSIPHRTQMAPANNLWVKWNLQYLFFMFIMFIKLPLTITKKNPYVKKIFYWIWYLN